MDGQPPVPNNERTTTPVKREKAEQYLLISLVAFAATVSLTRLFLELTGYPQLGNSELHIAHVLWGGLFLFGAALLPLVFANHWALFWSALLSGIGIGLFIDEVGKFITQTNDYFYPPAAPIIYGFFVITVLIYLRVRRTKSQTAREELYRALHEMTELLDNDLDKDEKRALVARLENIMSSATEADQIKLASSLLSVFQSEELALAPKRVHPFHAAIDRTIHALDRLLKRSYLKLILMVGLGVIGVLSILDLVTLTLFSVNVLRGADISRWVSPQEIESANDLLWFSIRLAIQGMVGGVSLIGFLLFALNKDDRAVFMGTLGLTTSLVAVNLLIFYQDQFSAIVGALVELLLLLGLLAYRRRFILSDHPTIH